MSKAATARSSRSERLLEPEPAERSPFEGVAGVVGCRVPVAEGRPRLAVVLRLGMGAPFVGFNKSEYVPFEVPLMWAPTKYDPFVRVILYFTLHSLLRS